MTDPTDPYHTIVAALCRLGGSYDDLMVTYERDDGETRRRADALCVGLDALATLAHIAGQDDNDALRARDLATTIWHDVVATVNDRTHAGRP